MKRVLLRFLLGAFWIPLAAAAAPPTSQEIARAIEELGAPQFDTRQAASELLWGAGEAVAAALGRAAASPDPEVRTRAEELLQKLRLGIRPNTPADAIEVIDQFRQAKSSNERQQALRGLQSKEQWHTIVALLRSESNPAEREAFVSPGHASNWRPTASFTPLG